MLSKSIGLINVVRRAPSCSLAGIQKSYFSQNFNFDAKEEVRALENNLFESNVLIKQRIAGFSCRTFSTTVTEESGKEKQKNEFPGLKENENWVPIYRFPGIAFSAFISKLKFLQTFGSACIIPWATYNYASGYQTFEFLLSVYGAAILAPITLFAFSRSFNRMIGVISMNESKEYIRVGYLSFYGTRKNAIIPIDDIMPLSDVVSTMEKYPKVLQLKRFSNPNEWFYIPGRGCHIVDKERAKLVFGSLGGFLEIPDRYLPKQVDNAKDEYLTADKKLTEAEANYEKTKKDLINKFKNE